MRVILPTLLAFVSWLQLGCTSEVKPDPVILAVQDYIAVAELPEVRRIPTDRRDTYQELDNQRYVIFKTRRKSYLLEFRRNCWELRDNFNVVADTRVEASNFYPGIDTLRGCPTSRAWELNEGQAEEIRTLGEAPTGG